MTLFLYDFSMENKILKISQDTHWDFVRKSLISNGKAVLLSSAQTKVFEMLAMKAGKQVESLDLFSFVWDDYDKEFNSKYIRNIVSSIRKKAPNIDIKNVYGGLYVLMSDNQADDGDLSDDKSENSDESAFGDGNGDASNIVVKKKKDCCKKEVEFSQYFFDIIEFNPISTVVIKPSKDNYSIVFVNEAFREMLKIDNKDQVLGTNVFDIFTVDPNYNKVHIIKSSLIANKSVSVVVGLTTLTNETIYARFILNPIFNRTTNEIKYFVGVCKDVSIIANAFNSLSSLLATQIIDS